MAENADEDRCTVDQVRGGLNRIESQREEEREFGVSEYQQNRERVKLSKSQVSVEEKPKCFGIK